MSQTHQVEIRGEVVIKTYVDWARDEHLREWAALRVISEAEPGLVPTPINLVEPVVGAASVERERPVVADPGEPGESVVPVEPGESVVGPAQRRVTSCVGWSTRPVVTMSRVAGWPMGGRLTGAQLEGLHEALGALWSVPPSSTVPAIVGQRAGSGGASVGLVAQDFRALIARVRRGISEWEGLGVAAVAHAAAGGVVVRPGGRAARGAAGACDRAR